ncbi:MAG TPA: nitrite reductase, partial [Casimicrobiaceae bacterium]
IRLAHELEARMPGFNNDIKLHVTGCPNSCGQHWIADVGLQGVLMTRGGAQVEGYDLFVGGALGKDSGIARRLGYRVAAVDAAETLTRLFSTYVEDRIGAEAFSAWVNRVPDADLRAVLAGAASAVAIDASSGALA